MSEILEKVIMHIPTSVSPKTPCARILAVLQRDLEFCHTLHQPFLENNGDQREALDLFYLVVGFLMTSLPNLSLLHKSYFIACITKA